MIGGVCHRRHHVVLEVLPDTCQFVHHIDPDAAEMFAGTDTRQHISTCGELIAPPDKITGLDRMLLAILHVDHAVVSSVCDHEAGHVGAGDGCAVFLLRAGCK